MTIAPPKSAGLLARLFRKFDEEDVCYCVLRNFEGLPQALRGDIDILMDSRQRAKVESIVKGISNEESCLMRKIEKNGHLQYILIDRDEVNQAVKSNRPINSVVLDFQTRLHWNGLTYQDAGAVLSQRQRRGEIFVASRQDRTAHLMCHVILDKNYVRSEYQEALRKALSMEGKALLSPLVPFLGASAVSALCAAGQSDEAREVLALRKLVIKSLLLSRPGAILSWANFRLKKYMRICRAMLFPPGVMVATMGPDGAGKSTLASRVATVLQGEFNPVRTQYMGWKDFVLPTKRLFALVQRAMKPRRGTGIDDEGKSEPLSAPSWLQSFSVLHYFLDLWARYLLYIRPALSRGGLVICDRYFFDIYARDAWVCKNPWVRRLLLALIPRPSVTVLLSGNQEEIFRRKREISVTETARQLASFGSIKDRVEGTLELDATSPIESNACQVVKAILRTSESKAGA